MELEPVNPTAKAPAERFTGDVYVTPIHNGQEPSRMTVALVRFTPGAHTNWHSHAVGQTLHVTGSLRGRLPDRGARRRDPLGERPRQGLRRHRGAGRPADR